MSASQDGGVHWERIFEDMNNGSGLKELAESLLVSYSAHDPNVFSIYPPVSYLIYNRKVIYI